MCEEYKPCKCLRPTLLKSKRLTLLLLDCWQREYDKRPYRNFRLKRIAFEERMKRSFHPVKDFSVVVRFLCNRSLCSAYLSGIRVVPYEQKLVKDFVHSLKQLRRIELRCMNLPTRFFEQLTANVAIMNVKELIFEGTPLTTPDVVALQSFLVASKTLLYINVAACSINQNNFALLADGIHKSTSVRGFNCSRLLGQQLTLDTTKIAYIVSSLIWQNKLEEIEMQQCEFVAYDMEIFTEYMIMDSKLCKLNLAYNILGPDGAEILFRAVIRGNTLTHLNLSGNGLGSHGGEVVARYLSSCYNLRYLNITYNAIGHEATNSILTAMKKPIKLEKLKMQGNQFNTKSANILRRLLDARVVPQDYIDISVTFDETLSDYRVIPFINCSKPNNVFL